MLVRPSDFTARLLRRLNRRTLPVHSVFERSINLLIGPTILLTITSPSLGRSPFGLAAQGDLAPILPTIRRADALTWHAGALWAAGARLFTLAAEPPYPSGLAVADPHPSADAPTFHRLLQGLVVGQPRGLAELLPHWPRGGPLTPVAEHPALQSPWIARASTAMAVFGRGDAAELPAAAPRLLGLGIGLTPSGDDFLIGYLAGRLAQGRRAEVRAIGRALAPRAFTATSLVSASYLRHAFRGRFGSQLRHLIGVLHTPSTSPAELRAAASQVIAVGSTSGWDSLIGLLTALYRYQSETDPAPPR